MKSSAVTRAFRLGFTWKPREETHDDDDVVADNVPSPINDAVYRFVSENEGSFTLHFGDTDVEFDLEMDLPIVFKYVPEALKGIVRDEGAPHYVSFSNQATALGIKAVRSDRELTLEFEPIWQPPEYFHQFLAKQFRVDAAEFVGEWARFLSAVLGALLERDASLGAEPEMRAYIESVERLKSTGPSSFL